MEDAPTLGISVKRYACKVCDRDVIQTAEDPPAFSWFCEHEHAGAGIVAWLKGTVHAVGSAEARGRRLFGVEAIPEPHRAVFVAGPMRKFAFERSGKLFWTLADWERYIVAWHLSAAWRAAALKIAKDLVAVDVNAMTPQQAAARKEAEHLAWCARRVIEQLGEGDDKRGDPAGNPRE